MGQKNEPRLAQLFTLKQVHGDKVICLNDDEATDSLKESEADAVLSSIPNLSIAVKTADCVPILLAHPDGIIGAIHAGWRGSSQHILIKTLELLQQNYQADLTQVKIKIGPAICQSCYEVGEEVAKHFQEYQDAVATHGKKFLLNLKRVNFQQAIAAGLSESQIAMDPVCTFCSEEYYSYRRAQKNNLTTKGRNYSWISQMPPTVISGIRKVG